MHQPVLLEEVISLLKPKSGKVYVDCTIGYGGHTKALLKSGAKVYGIDRDLETINKLKIKHQNLKILWANFRNLDELIKEKVDGVLFDIGISTGQLNSPGRGFSYKMEGPLDMRMDRSRGVPCYKLLKELSVDDIEYILKKYGEEAYSWRIARILAQEKPETTQELRKIIIKATPQKWRVKILARVWQSLRIFVNDELVCLEEGIHRATNILKLKGRICVISYHSLEDRIVKQYFKEEARLKIITKKPIRPDESEIHRNPSSRSAKLRCAEKIK
jgi:16S rRNA (cytosine1402-N4)-methyltransferase